MNQLALYNSICHWNWQNIWWTKKCRCNLFECLTYFAILSRCVSNYLLYYQKLILFILQRLILTCQKISALVFHTESLKLALWDSNRTKTQFFVAKISREQKNLGLKMTRNKKSRQESLKILIPVLEFYNSCSLTSYQLYHKWILTFLNCILFLRFDKC